MQNRPYGVLGRVLGHSYTPAIYRELAGLDYRKFEREPDEVEAFLASDDWEGVNVTIPYKRTVMPYLDEISPIARRLGNVNTITRMDDGRLRGDNTDYYGFKVLVQSMDIDLDGKVALVFGGDGGAGSTCCTVLEDLGMEVHPVGRTGTVTYEGLDAWQHAALAVNCTPVGMYPRCPESVCDLDVLTGLEGLVDIVYNPARTGLMLQAERRGIRCAGGLLMLVAQAAEAVERYTGRRVDMKRIEEVTRGLSESEQNIALIGMPGSGKTRVGEQIARLTGRRHVDIDRQLEEKLGTTCADYIVAWGEEAFRDQEAEILRSISGGSGQVISCGGGIVMRSGNYDLLHQNSRIIMLDRPLQELARKGRPITARDGIDRLAAIRMPLYRAWSDITVPSQVNAEHTARLALSLLDREASDVR